MSKVKPRGKVPKKAAIDEVIEIKTLIRHPMHSGRMKDKDGKNIPRQIINSFKVDFEIVKILKGNCKIPIGRNKIKL